MHECIYEYMVMYATLWIFIHLNELSAWLYANAWNFDLHEILFLLFEDAHMNVWKFPILPFQMHEDFDL